MFLSSFISVLLLYFLFCTLFLYFNFCFNLNLFLTFYFLPVLWFSFFLLSLSLISFLFILFTSPVVRLFLVCFLLSYNIPTCFSFPSIYLSLYSFVSTAFLYLLFSYVTSFFMPRQCLRTSLLQDHLAAEPVLGCVPPLKCNISHDPLRVCDKEKLLHYNPPSFILLDAAPHHPSAP